MTAALAAMNAEDFMIGTPAAPSALGVDYLIFQIDPDPGLLAKSRDYTYNSGTGGSLDGSSANRKLPVSMRVAPCYDFRNLLPKSAGNGGKGDGPKAQLRD